MYVYFRIYELLQQNSLIALCLLQSDPLLVIYTRGRDGAVQEVGRTEMVINSLNPIWITKHTMAFQFEVVQTLL